MAAHKAGLACWLGLITLLWSLYPLLFSQARGVVMLVILTGGLALFGWMTGTQFLVAWSGGLGLFNLTLTLVITAQPPNLWVGLSAGITLLALLDGSQRFAYLRHCQVEPGVLTAWLGVFMRLTGLSLMAGIALALLVVNLPTQGEIASAAGLLTIAGASLFVGVLALLLLYTSRWPER
ncbi:MAG: hypothetical protein ACRERE_12245 [Candidatus Entotheonellia bacterium]